MENILITEGSGDYELLDSGNGEKLERYGKFIVARPDPQVLWHKSLGREVWEKADATYVRTGVSGKWNKGAGFAAPWQVSIEGQTFSLNLLPSKHLGLFPEQSPQWKWIYEKIKEKIENGEKVSVLNLFGYTGGATMAAARAGASVVHLDASKFAVDLAKVNLNESGLGDKPVRLIVDDARKFVEREIKRGAKYDLIVLDPPVYGKGAKGEVWKLEEDLPKLLSRLNSITSDRPLGIILNGYASGYSRLTYGEVLRSAISAISGAVVTGEYAIKESMSGRLLPAGIFARFEGK